ncbi:hypothetical protein [Winogradskyella sp. 3972H.M.0a.05]|uniref:hypothetical protein n=1 Tax=Winogradskyella sp. 3972H.M.0a.05 TaxID=2950277 RepID=UPI00339296B4
MKFLATILILIFVQNLFAQDVNQFNPAKEAVKLTFEVEPTDLSERTFIELDSIYKVDPKTLFYLGSSEFTSDLTVNNSLSKNQTGHITLKTSNLNKVETVFFNKNGRKYIIIDSKDLPESVTIPKGKTFIEDLHSDGTLIIHGKAWKYYKYNPNQKKLVLDRIIFTKELQDRAIATYYSDKDEWKFGKASDGSMFPACDLEVLAPTTRARLLITDDQLLPLIISNIPDYNTLNGQVFLTCKVNCRSQIAEVSTLRVIGIHKKVARTLEEVFKDLNPWTTAFDNGSPVDSRITFMVRFTRGQVRIARDDDI